MTQRLRFVVPLLLVVDAALFLSARFLSVWPGLVLALALTAALWKTLPKDLWRFRPVRRDIQFAFGAFGLLLAVASIARIADGGFDAAYATMIGLTDAASLVAFLGVVCITVLKEELFLRVLQGYLLRWPVWFGAGLLAVNFALLHTPFFAFRFAPLVWGAVASSAFVLAVLFAATRNFLVTVCVHVLLDAVLLLQIYLHARAAAVAEALLWVCFAVVIAFSVPHAKRLLQDLRREAVSFEAAFLGALIAVFAGLAFFAL